LVMKEIGDQNRLPNKEDGDMKTKTWFVGLGLLAAVAFSGVSNAGNPAVNFDNYVLNGRYIGQATATEWYTPPGQSILKLDISDAFVEQLDGRGNAVGSLTEVIGGTFEGFTPTVCVYSSSGTYSLNDDGTGTGIFNFTTTSPGCVDGQQTFALTYLSNGSKYCGVVTGFSLPPGVEVTSILGSFCATKQ
jgi:hypothetical protein